MKISINKTTLKSAKGLIVVPLNASDLRKSGSPTVRKLNALRKIELIKEIKRREFDGSRGTTLLLEDLQNTQTPAILFFGLGDSEEGHYQRGELHRQLGAQILKNSQDVKLTDVSVLSHESILQHESELTALLEGIELSAYTFSSYLKQPTKKRTTRLALHFIDATISLNGKGRTLAQATVAGCSLARDLVNTPACDCKPKDLVRAAQNIAKTSGLTVKIFDKTKLKKLKAGALLSVAAGSNEAPYLIKLTYTPKSKSKKHLAIVGKGVTFDSGGLSIKQGPGMMTMKTDMAGAAAILGTMRAIARLKPKIKVSAYVPTTENMINGKATRPGDVVRAMNGKSIEILNTDAEGRLILADALCMAEKDGADTIVDLATLTGAVLVALGPQYAGLFSNSEKLTKNLQAAGEKAGEHLWELPLAPEYETMIKSQIADIRNIGAGRSAGSITAALFLKQFVHKAQWAHIDIAGTAYSEKEAFYAQFGASGFGVRTLVHYIMQA